MRTEIKVAMGKKVLTPSVIEKLQAYGMDCSCGTVIGLPEDFDEMKNDSEATVRAVAEKVFNGDYDN